MSTDKSPTATIKILPSHIEGARGLLGMSQAELAEAAGVPRETVGRLEARKVRPRPATIAKLVKALEDRGIEFTNGKAPGVRFWPERAKIKGNKPVAATAFFSVSD